MSLAAVAAGVLLGCVLAAAVIGDPPVLGSLVIVAAGAAVLLLTTRHPEWELALHVIVAVLLGIVAGWSEDRIWWLAVVSIATAIITFGLAAVRAQGAHP